MQFHRRISPCPLNITYNAVTTVTVKSNRRDQSKQNKRKNSGISRGTQLILGAIFAAKHLHGLINRNHGKPS